MSIYKKFCREQWDAHGNLIRLDFTYPENFNFGYDVVDEIAAQTPDKTALVWCNTENEEHIFTFADIRRYSNRAANVLKAKGIGRGDRVLVVLKRHYEYWFVAVALHKLGAVMIPATHMLTVKDLEYRIGASHADAIICTPQDGVPENILQALVRRKNAAFVVSLPRRHGQLCRSDGGDAVRRRDAGATSHLRGRPDADVLYVGHHGRAQGRDP